VTIMSQRQETWRLRAACIYSPPRWFFPRPITGRSSRTASQEVVRKVQKAKEICATCPVRGACLDYALTNHEPEGVWGGIFFENGKMTDL